MGLVTVGLFRVGLVTEIVRANLHNAAPLLVADTQLTATTEMGDFN
jgi:hypothetical protein